MRPLNLAGLLLAATILAGCSDGSGPAGFVDAGPPSGELSGQVVDDELRPVPDANVSLNGTEFATLTDSAGRFAFHGVPQGLYTLRVAYDGYFDVDRDVTVKKGRALSVNVALEPIPHHEGHFETFPFVGLQRCMWYSPSFKSGCTFPYTLAVGTLAGQGVNVSDFGAPQDVMENQYRYNFTVHPGHTGIVSELAWRANTEASRIYVLELSCAWYDPVVDDCVAPGQATWDPGNTYARARGVSPLRIEWEHAKPDWMPWVMSRAYLSGDTMQPVGFALDQRVEMYNTVFYDGPVPAGFALAAE